MNRLESFLTRATKGLWGKKRLEVMAELRGSLEARVWKLECQGETPEHALELALREMGAPQQISAGLIRIHTMPNITKIGFAAVAAAALCIASLSSSQAQVGWAIPQVDLNSNISCLCGDLYVSLTDLKTTLKQAGATVTESVSSVQSLESVSPVQSLYVPRYAIYNGIPINAWGSELPVRTLEIAFQHIGQKYVVVLQALGTLGNLDKTESLAKTPESAEYVPFSYVLDQLRRTKLPIKLEGWQRPKISVGNFSLTLERAGEFPNTSALYQAGFYQWWQYGSGRPGVRNPLLGGVSLAHFAHGPSSLLRNSSSPMPSITGSMKQTTTATGAIRLGEIKFEHRHAIRTNMPANTVFAIVASAGGFRAKLGEDGTPVILSMARTNAQGILEFTTPYKFLEFGGNSLLEKATRADAGSEKHPAQALLFRLTGRLEEGVKPVELVLPAKRKIMALK
jgi:hypothetical protein